MHLDVLEKSWAWIVAIIIAGMLAAIFYTAFALGDMGIHPPSNVEPIDSTRLHLTEEFAEDNLGVFENADGSVTVRMVASRYGFYPPDVTIPADTPVTFRFATPDVLHGLHVPGTNVDTMVIPGYVSQLRTVINYNAVAAFGAPNGDGSIRVPLYCNEYCGLGHHYMWTRLTIEPKAH
ncbi:MAG: cytochrome c oxidase subunit II [Gammaproteobacteria bacterium]|jgi:cytochrome c oxidase subunit 2